MSQVYHTLFFFKTLVGLPLHFRANFQTNSMGCPHIRMGNGWINSKCTLVCRVAGLLLSCCELIVVLVHFTGYILFRMSLDLSYLWDLSGRLRVRIHNEHPCCNFITLHRKLLTFIVAILLCRNSFLTVLPQQLHGHWFNGSLWKYFGT